MSVQPLRPDIYVVGRLLAALVRASEPPRPTQLQQSAGLNYTVFSRYLRYLVERGLVETSGGPDSGDRIALTPRGREAYQILSDRLAEILGRTLAGDLRRSAERR